RTRRAAPPPRALAGCGGGVTAITCRALSVPSPLLSAEARLLAKADAGEGQGGGKPRVRCVWNPLPTLPRKGDGSPFSVLTSQGGTSTRRRPPLPHSLLSRGRKKIAMLMVKPTFHRMERSRGRLPI